MSYLPYKQTTAVFRKYAKLFFFAVLSLLSALSSDSFSSVGMLRQNAASFEGLSTLFADNGALQQNESSWAQPKNSNPVEKRQAGHDTEPAVEEAGQAAEKAKQSVVDTAKQAREAVEKLTKKGDE